MCDASPCQNGASCRAIANDYECGCLPTFYGKKCEKSWITRSDYETLQSTAVFLSSQLEDYRRLNASLQAALAQLKTDLQPLLQEQKAKADRRRLLVSEGWRTFSGNGCFYKLSPSWYRRMFDARSYCKASSAGADLVMIRNENEWSWLKRVYRLAFYWIGATDEGHEGTWKWFDGSPMTIFKWSGTHNPDNHQGNEHCVAATGIHHEVPSQDQGLWNDVACVNTEWSVDLHAMCKVCF